MKRYRKLMASILFLFMLLGATPVSAEPADVSITGQGRTATDGALETISDVTLSIDSNNLYDGMDHTYSQGYIPKVENGYVRLVLPLQCSGKLEGNCVKASLNLGDYENAPFVIKNYERNIYQDKYWVNNGSQLVESFAAVFLLELKNERKNGSYPVVIDITAYDSSGSPILQSFTVYVNITDGQKQENDEADNDADEKRFAPKMIVGGCDFSKPELLAGDEFTANITLINTSKTESVRDLSITALTPADAIVFLEQSDTVYIESVSANDVCTVTYHLKVNANALQGQHELELQMSYADSQTNAYTCSGKIRIPITQPVKLQFDAPDIPSTVQVADIIETSVQVMNLGKGKVYNLRAILNADGLDAGQTIFIGDVEPGATGSGSVSVSVSGLTKGDSPYGKTDGIISFCYEDENGQEHSEDIAFQTTIESPFWGQSATKEDRPEQWLMIMAMLVEMIIVCSAAFLVRRAKRRNMNGMLKEMD